MRLKRIKLNNIRSYKEQEIEFARGSTLLAGDIGSGKTSILLGIEFALFGLQPGQRGNSILRNGENQGKAEIEFEVDDKNIIIERSLKKAKTISQDYCSITIDGEKIELSVTELKNKILDLLNYPKEFSKKQNILYKFTVYTPQEEMKQIILQDSETRINTLRHVFGIDKYKKILENISVTISRIREEKRICEARTFNLEEDKNNLIEKQKELLEKEQFLIETQSELLLKTNNREIIEKEQEEISNKRQEKLNLQQEIEKTKIIFKNKEESISQNNRTIKQLDAQLQEFSQLEFDEIKIIQLEKELDELKQSKYDFSELNLKISSQIASLNMKDQENENTKNKISRLEMCPTCLQDVDAVYKSNVINEIDKNTSENIQKIQTLNIEKTKISEKLNSFDFEISEKQKQIHELNILKIKLQGINEKQTQIQEIQKINSHLEKDLGILNDQLKTLQNLIFDLNKFDNLYEEKQKQLEIAKREERIIEIKIAELKKETDFFKIQIVELTNKIKSTEEIKEKFNYLSKLEHWITTNFIPLISNVEKNVMVKLKAEFSQLFSEWFAMLVSDSFHVHLDDNFTPIIEYQDYEIDYAYLSGGERTAIALAYRLALNQVINSLLSKIKTQNLVILDEPTDGFSEQQLDKMRNVLEQLNIEQLIIVSHEQKIEGFVENVIRFKKENGVSRRE